MRSIRNSGIREWLVTAVTGAVVILVICARPVGATDDEEKRPREGDPVVFDQTAGFFQQDPSPFVRSVLLQKMFGEDVVRAFPIIYQTLLADSAVAKEKAAVLISKYYTEFVMADGDERLRVVRFPDVIIGKRAEILGHLRGMQSTDRVDLRLAVYRSLIRMGEGDEIILEKLFRIAVGEGREEWKYGDTGCWATREGRIAEVQRQAAYLMLLVRRHGVFGATVDDYLNAVLDSINAQGPSVPRLTTHLMAEHARRSKPTPKVDAAHYLMAKRIRSRLKLGPEVYTGKVEHKITLGADVHLVVQVHGERNEYHGGEGVSLVWHDGAVFINGQQVNPHPKREEPRLRPADHIRRLYGTSPVIQGYAQKYEGTGTEDEVWQRAMRLLIGEMEYVRLKAGEVFASHVMDNKQADRSPQISDEAAERAAQVLRHEEELVDSVKIGSAPDPAGKTRWLYVYWSYEKSGRGESGELSLRRCGGFVEPYPRSITIEEFETKEFPRYQDWLTSEGRTVELVEGTIGLH